jgi:hypothetical protein
LQGKLLLGERIIYFCVMRTKREFWEQGKGGMRCAFPPYRYFAPPIFFPFPPSSLPAAQRCTVILYI